METEFLTNLFDTEFIVSHIPTLIRITVVVVLFTILYMVLKGVLMRALAGTNMAPALQKIVVYSILRWVIIVFALITVLNQLGIDVTAAVAGVGIAGIAIGFAAKETLANILSGFSIFIDKLYVTGDWVEVVGHYGQVKEITLRTTKIRTLDNIFIIVPNSEVTMNPVTNFSEEGMVRITANIGIAYSASIDQAREVLIGAAKSIEGVLQEPAPKVVVDSLGDSSVNLKVRMWVDDPGTDPHFRFMLIEGCKKALDEASIEIPFPQRVVHNA